MFGNPEVAKKAMVLLAGHNSEEEKTLSEIVQETYGVVFADTEEEVLSILQDKDNVISAAIISSEKALSILRSIRLIPALEDFPVLISTSVINTELENELLELNIVDFLKEPFDPRRVLNRLKTAIKLDTANKVISELERDELTGLFTRQAFLRKADKIRKENPNKKFAVLAFDFENFKSTNTLYGEAKC